MDAPVVQVEACAPSREVLRERSGQRLGTLEVQPYTCWVIARTPSGQVVGIYEPEPRDRTRNASGYVIGSGNLLTGLLLLERFKSERAR
ncbi:MAG TPA: hypothetical protein VGU45_11825 [Microvirga sp.]|jgi:hypothetical protein|nr:hypothetical protein [Microvirga sp.]